MNYSGHSFVWLPLLRKYQEIQKHLPPHPLPFAYFRLTRNETLAF